MRTSQRKFALTVASLTGGLLAAALLPTAVAIADNYDLTPDISTFVPSQVEGYPPLINVVTGAESWNLFDLTTNSVSDPNVIDGTDTETTFGSFINDDYLASSPLTVGFPTEFLAPAGTQIDLANFGLGFENEWINIPSGINTGVSDLLITPFGDFPLFGTGFADLSAVLMP